MSKSDAWLPCVVVPLFVQPTLKLTLYEFGSPDGMLVVNVNTPHVKSVQTGGVAPKGVEGFDAANGPPLKLKLGPEGDTMPAEGVVATTSGIATKKKINEASAFKK